MLPDRKELDRPEFLTQHTSRIKTFRIKASELARLPAEDLCDRLDRVENAQHVIQQAFCWGGRGALRLQAHALQQQQQTIDCCFALAVPAERLPKLSTQHQSGDCYTPLRMLQVSVSSAGALQGRQRIQLQAPTLQQQQEQLFYLLLYSRCTC